MTPQHIKTLIAVEDGVSRETVRMALPETNSSIEIVGLVDGFEDAWPVLQETPTDLLVIACAAGSDRGLYMVDGAVKQRPDRPVIVLAEGHPNGFVQRAFEAGADDIVSLPE